MRKFKFLYLPVFISPAGDPPVWLRCETPPPNVPKTPEKSAEPVQKKKKEKKNLCWTCWPLKRSVRDRQEIRGRSTGVEPRQNKIQMETNFGEENKKETKYANKKTSKCRFQS